jgi:hypothetical protein
MQFFFILLVKIDGIRQDMDRWEPISHLLNY